MNRFSDLPLIEPLLRAIHEEGYEIPTPIQARSIPPVLEGKDLLGCAQTGTGKTAAFALPILQRLTSTPPAPPPAAPGTHAPATGHAHHAPTHGPRPIRALILAPTRELASQIGDSFAAYGRHLKIRHTVIFGGVGQNPQVTALRHGVDVVIATPGRLLDLMQQRQVRLERVEILVLDEADRMLDMGFIHDVRRIVSALPKKRQTVFYSATMPNDILGLARDILANPVRVEVTPQATTVEKIRQSLYHVDRHGKFHLLRRLLADPGFRRTIVFTRTKRGANKLADMLSQVGVKADAIHGNKSQNARERALDAFKGGSSRVLVATDIAARGIDVEQITHVINYDLPEVPESYVHRIGRTARAGAEGAAIAFCSPDERADLAAIEKLIRQRIPVTPLPSDLPSSPHPAPSGQSHAHAHGHQGRPKGQGFGRKPGGPPRRRFGR